jgi:hypothetical protein
MDPRERADAILARARARGAFVVTPESAVSPMDASSTLQIPRAVVAANDERDEEDPDATMVVPASVAHGRHYAVPAQEPHHDDELPAITQEALTDVVANPPGPRSRQRRLEQHQSMMAQREQQRQESAPSPSPEPEEVDGLIPTVKQPPTTRSTLSQRLDG